MAKSDIKWRRKSLRVSSAAENAERMYLQLFKEAYEKLKPGQLVRVLKEQEQETLYTSLRPEALRPQVPEGQILMFLRWAEYETAEEVGDPWLKKWDLSTEHHKFTGPVWVFGDRIHFRRIEPDEFEVLDEEEEK